MNEEIKVLFPDDVEWIKISKNDYDRLYGEMTYKNIQLQNRITELEEINREHQKINAELRAENKRLKLYLDKLFLVIKEMSEMIK